MVKSQHIKEAYNRTNYLLANTKKYAYKRDEIRYLYSNDGKTNAITHFKHLDAQKSNRSIQAREFIVPIPNQMDKERQKEFVKLYVNEFYKRMGISMKDYPFLAVVHNKEGKKKNHHLHFLISERPLLKTPIVKTTQKRWFHQVEYKVKDKIKTKLVRCSKNTPNAFAMAQKQKTVYFGKQNRVFRDREMIKNINELWFDIVKSNNLINDRVMKRITLTEKDKKMTLYKKDSQGNFSIATKENCKTWKVGKIENGQPNAYQVRAMAHNQAVKEYLIHIIAVRERKLHKTNEKIK